MLILVNYNIQAQAILIMSGPKSSEAKLGILTEMGELKAGVIINIVYNIKIPFAQFL